MKNRSRYGLLGILFLALLARCNKSYEHEPNMDSPATAHLVDAWSTSERSPLLRLLALYDNNRFILVESSDVGGEARIEGTYRRSDNEVFVSPDKSFKRPGEFFRSQRNDGSVEILFSSMHDGMPMYKCRGLVEIEDWGRYIQNDVDFQKRSSQGS